MDCEALLAFPNLMAITATSAILHASKITVAARRFLYALLILALATTVGLEICEAALAATSTVDALGLTLLASTVDALRLTFTATATLNALSLAPAAAFHALRLAFAATATLDPLRLLTTATAAALGLGVTAMATTLSSALVRLR